MQVIFIIGLAASAVYTASAAVCSGSSFDNSYLMCCNGVIAPRPGECVSRPNHKCCSQFGFDNGAFMCCFGDIHRRPGGSRAHHKCCSDSDGKTEAFNNQEKMCCYGVLNERPSGDNSNHKCCGTTAFNQKEFFCKGGELVPI